MINALNGPKSAAAAVSAIAAGAGDTSSDAILVNRIAAGDKLAMHALFARYRTSIYRWLLRFVASEARRGSAERSISRRVASSRPI